MKTKKMLGISIKLIIVSIVLFSVVYHLLVGGLGQIWAGATRGSLIEKQGQPVGSRLIGQRFESEEYFQGRPSSKDYDAGDSGSANLAPNNPELVTRVRDSLNELARDDSLEVTEIPADLITESGSTLDPHITVRAARLQIPRIARVTGVDPDLLEEIVTRHTRQPLLNLYGEERVNLLELNLELREVLAQ